MSEMERNKGRLIPVNKSIDEIVYSLTDNIGSYDSKKEWFDDYCHDYGYCTINGKVFEVFFEVRHDAYLEFCDLVQNGDGSISFHECHYNGGAYWTEVVSDALEKIENNQRPD